MPPLPFELERQIFEIAALQDTNHNHRIQIILVAKRVYEWIRPILYRVVIIGNDLLENSRALTINNWPNPKITNSGRFVRHLLTIPGPGCFHRLIDIVSMFPNIENLATWANIISCGDLNKLNKLPLRRLSLYLGLRTLHEAIELCPAFKNLTHLEIFSFIRQDSTALLHLPKLTHLSFTFSCVEDAVVLDLLKQCVSLRVFLCVSMQGFSWRIPPGSTTVDDPRYLDLRDLTSQDFIEEWVRSANGLVGFWELAEVIIEARKANLFKDTTPSFLSLRTWIEHLNDDGRRWYEEWSR